MNNFLSREEAYNLVDNSIADETSLTSTQKILDSGAIPLLKGFQVRPGKVSDCIFGGKGNYIDKITGETIEFENPPLITYHQTPLILMVRTERISTHDINRGDIPFKDQILASNHISMRRLIKDAIGTSQYDIPGLEDNSIVIAAEKLTQIPFENVLRAYMATSTTDTNMGNQYLNNGIRIFSGHNLPIGLTANCKLPYVMDTPSTKSDIHDETVTPEYLFRQSLNGNRICSPQQYRQIINNSLVAFGIVSHYLTQRGLILVDTKTEHGINIAKKIVSQDELYTMDSSRFWLLDDYNEQLKKLKKGEIQDLNPKSFSKEFARGFSKGDQGYNQEARREIAVRYIEGYQQLLGKRFEPDLRSKDERVISGLETAVNALVS